MINCLGRQLPVKELGPNGPIRLSGGHECRKDVFIMPPIQTPNQWTDQRRMARNPPFGLSHILPAPSVSVSAELKSVIHIYPTCQNGGLFTYAYQGYSHWIHTRSHRTRRPPNCAVIVTDLPIGNKNKVRKSKQTICEITGKIVSMKLAIIKLFTPTYLIKTQFFFMAFRY